MISRALNKNSIIGIFHIPSDMPGLTQDAKILACSQGCPRQIVSCLPMVYGFQCYPEPLKDNIKAMVQNCLGDLAAKGTFIQSSQDLLTHDLADMNTFLTQFLDRITVFLKPS